MPVTWPGGARSATCFTFDLDAEEVWLVDEDNAEQRPVILSQGRYGPRVAVPLILELLRRYRVPGTFFVPGRVAERHPDTVKAVIDAGHEIAHHGHTHRSPSGLSAEEDRAELVEGLRALRAFGVAVEGYRAPSWDPSPKTLSFAADAGLGYSSNFMDDIYPYVHEHSGLVEVPVCWTLDDAVHFWFSPNSWTKTMRTAREVAELWHDEAAGIATLGGVCVYTCHPQVIGRPGRLAVLEGALRAAVDDESNWIATTGAVAATVREEERTR